MRRIQHSVVCLLLVGLSAGASFALAPQDRIHPGDARWGEAPASWTFLGSLSDLLSCVWGRIGCKIDPYGRCVLDQEPAATPPAGSPDGPQGDIGCKIDPLGGCTDTH